MRRYRENVILFLVFLVSFYRDNYKLKPRPAWSPLEVEHYPLSYDWGLDEKRQHNTVAQATEGQGGMLLTIQL